MKSKSLFQNKVIAVVGLGYVGLPLAVEFSKKYKTIGYDINPIRIAQLKSGNDITLEVEKEKIEQLLKQGNLSLTFDKKELLNANVYIVTVPTPIDKHKNPDLSPLIKASELVGSFIKMNDLIIYESTVYPGVTEEICVPILEKSSNKVYNKDFFVGYSPERINPGDKIHTLINIKKVTSGSNPETAKLVNYLYSSIINAGTYIASSIKVAEAAKIIENSQRDINIAFVNELSKIFNLMGINTNEVLAAAATKWNFLNFKPGLVGGHCIGVDPYYLAQKAQEIGYHPDIILAGRRINDGMGKYVATETIRLMVNKGIHISKSNLLLLGFTFKENCPDIRNTKVIDIVNELMNYKINLIVVDPWASIEDVKQEFNLNIFNKIPTDKKFDSVIAAVAHSSFSEINISEYTNDKNVIFDVKGIFEKKYIDGGL
jgi:UDP-N-acetyl-D-galactosamine dehydrogenase